MRLTPQKAATLAERRAGRANGPGGRISGMGTGGTPRPGGSKRATLAPRARRESEIQREVLLALRAVGVICWRASVGRVWLPGKGGQRRLYQLGVPGQPDIIGLVPVRVPLPIEGEALRLGVFVGVEIKRPGQAPTLEQRMFLEAITAGGGLAVVAHSVEEAIAPVLARMKGPFRP